jgi:hypothetical protein
MVGNIVVGVFPVDVCGDTVATVDTIGNVDTISQ